MVIWCYCEILLFLILKDEQIFSCIWYLYYFLFLVFLLRLWQDVEKVGFIGL